jgi:hypothetical protein
MSSITKEKVFEFLDEIRDWGGINMYGAGRHIQEAFGVSRQEARNLLSEWMKTFSERHSTP